MLGTAWGYRWGSLGAGMIGAVIGTIGGYEVRTRLVAANGGRDRPIALGEDVFAAVGRHRGGLPHQRAVRSRPAIRRFPRPQVAPEPRIIVG